MPAPRKPTQLKVVAGTAQACRLNPREPKPQTSTHPTPPKHMTAAGRKAWRLACDALASIRVLSDADLIALETLAETYATILDLRVRIAALDGPVYETTTQTGGTMRRPHPEIGLLADQVRLLRGFLAAFGMTPADRSRVSASPGGDEANPFALI